MLRSRLIAISLAAVLGLGLLPPAHSAPAKAAAAVRSTDAASGSSIKKSSPKAHATKKSRATRALRVATFNVRTARARYDKRKWLRRAPDVAREILSRNPGIVALQELGPGRADGRRGRLKGHVRQTTSLLKTLKRHGGGRYRLVRTTSYVSPRTKHGTQGARILYDSSRFRLASWCPERTGRRNYNRSCSFDLPMAAGDRAKLRRSAAYAQFVERRTGERFFVVSAHLDHRHSQSQRLERKYNRLRARQAAFISHRIARINRHHRPVVFGGDINSWRTDRGRYAPHRMLRARGYRDTATARVRVNLAYPTINHWRTVVRRSRFAARLDVLLVKGSRGVRKYENKMARVDHTRPSDHNMGVADILL